MFNIFKKKKHYITDPNFGQIESFSTRGKEVGWLIKKSYINSKIEILISGSDSEIDPSLKKILLKILDSEKQHKIHSENQLKEQYENAGLEFKSLKENFKLNGISIQTWGYELIFQEINKPNYFFRIVFEDFSPVGVAVDG